MSSIVLHEKLKDKLTDIIHGIKRSMISRFAILLPYDEAQSMLMSESVLSTLQMAGKLMEQQYMCFNYKLGETVIIKLTCRGGNNMPTILFPTTEFINFSEDFLDLIRPLYLITKSWIDVTLAFEAVCKIIQDTREFNFYMPWLRLIIPQDKDFTNKYNAPYRVTQWMGLHLEKHGTIDLITRQIQSILNNEYTSKRTWMPSELVQMVRQGEELVTQYNIMKTVTIPEKSHIEDYVSVEIMIDTSHHPTIKWTADAHTHRTIKEANRLRELDEIKANKLSGVMR